MHDLSYDEVQLDYELLLETAKIAAVHTWEKISQLVRETSEITADTSRRQANSRQIRTLSLQLLTASETWRALKKGLTRSQVIIGNKPEVKDK